MTIEELREKVQKNKADEGEQSSYSPLGLGAGGGQITTDEQIQAVCSRPRRLACERLFTRLAMRGHPGVGRCWLYLDRAWHVPKDETLDMMVKRGTYFDPNLLVLHNYLDKRESFTFTDAQLKTIENGLAPTIDVLKRARAEEGVKIIAGTGRGRWSAWPQCRSLFIA